MHMHQHCVAHLDLKPDNIHVLECNEFEGQFKLCNFGLVALLGAQDTSDVDGKAGGGG